MEKNTTVKIPVLTYHSIDESGSVISTAPETFCRQMKFLCENNYRVISIKELIENLTSKKRFIPKTVALTFDDGFRNFYTEAFPILAEYNFKATVFLVTDFCGKFNDWKGNPADCPRSPLLSWSEIKELNKAGIEFGAHTRAHADLTKISAAQAGREICESKAAIEDKLGTETDFFAYPYGKFNSTIREIAAKNFRAAFSVKLGKAQATSDFFALERIDCFYLKNPKIFNSIASPAFDFYMGFRQSLRDAKSLIHSN